MALEPRACIGVLDNGRTTLYTQNQTPTGARELLGAVFRAKAEDFRVVIGDVGGGFGMKTGLTPEDALVCYAAKKLGRPVKWRAERGEDFLAAHMGRDQHHKARIALDKDGRILALEVDTLGNIGAVPVGSSAIIPLSLGPKVQTTVYHVPLVHYRARAVLTHTMATGAYRGAGRPEANFLMERLIEKAAREMKLDPVEVRRSSFPIARISAIPTTRATSARCSTSCSRTPTGAASKGERKTPRGAVSCAAAGSRCISNGPARYPQRRSTSR